MYTNRFSSKRLWEYTRTVALSDKRSIWMSLVAFTGINILIYFVLNLGFFIGGRSALWLDMPRIVMVPTLATLGLWKVSGSFHLYLRPQQSALLMLPVTKSEKFTHAFIYSVFLIPLALGTIFFVHDAIWSFFAKETSVWHIVIQDISDSFLFQKGYIPGLELVTLILLLVSYIAFFFWGAIFFRRRQFLYTILALLGFVTVLAMIGASLSKVIDIQITVATTQIIVVTILFSFASGMFYWAWRKFTTLQITK